MLSTSGFDLRSALRHHCREVWRDILEDSRRDVVEEPVALIVREEERRGFPQAVRSQGANRDVKEHEVRQACDSDDLRREPPLPEAIRDLVDERQSDG